MIWAVIADDLTGAADTGVQFAKRGLSTLVLLDYQDLDPSQAIVVAADTESRHRSAADAYARTERAVSALQAAGVKFFYKKMDSTLRGNLGAELDAALDASGHEIGVVTPAFPANGRTTVGGHQLVAGVPLEQTAFARDPRQPVTDSFIPRVLGRQSRRTVGLVGLDVVRAGVRALVAEVQRQQKAGYQILVVDAVTRRDLRTIAAATISPALSCLAAGSAGLAEALSARAPMAGPAGAPPQAPFAGQGVLVVAGSTHPRSAEQVAELHTHRDAMIVGVPVDEELADAPPVLPGGGVMVLRLEGQVREPDPHTGQRLAERLARRAAAYLAAAGPRGLVLVGGDTAVAVLAAVGAQGLLIQSEVQPGIPRGWLVGGSYHGLPVVTKAGGFGNQRALLDAVDNLLV